MVQLVTGVREQEAIRPRLQAVGDEVVVTHLDRRVDVGKLGVVVPPETSIVVVAPFSAWLITSSPSGSPVSITW